MAPDQFGTRFSAPSHLAGIGRRGGGCTSGASVEAVSTLDLMEAALELLGVRGGDKWPTHGPALPE